MITRNVKIGLALLFGVGSAAVGCGRIGVEVVDIQNPDALPPAVEGGVLPPAGGANGAMEAGAMGGSVPDAGAGANPGMDAMMAMGGMAGTVARNGGGGMAGTGAGGTNTGGVMLAMGGAAGSAMGGMAGSAMGGSAGSAMGGMAGTAAGGAAGNPVPADWWDTNFKRRVRIDIDNSNVNQNLNNFPVRVSLNSPEFNFGATASGGADIRFIDSDATTVLSHEIEAWRDGQAAVLWVKVPRVSAAPTRDFFWLYYDGGNVMDGQNSEDVWSANYRAVWHMTTANDSTRFNNDGTPANVTQTPAIANAAGFDGISGSIDAGTRANLNGLFNGGGTITAIIFPESWGLNNFGRIVDRSDDNDAVNGWALQLDNGNDAPRRSLRFERGHAGGRSGWETTTGTLALDAWQMVALVYNNDDPMNLPRMFINGVEQTVLTPEPPMGAVQADTGRRCFIGNSLSADRTFEGAIDEVRLSNRARSAEWIEAQYLSLTDQMLTQQPEEQIP